MTNDLTSTSRLTAPAASARRPSVPLSVSLLATVVLVGAIAPLATDMYVPAFPLVSGDLQATATQVQLTLTTFFVGMALGQLVGGPVSDARGRRTPLLVSLGVLTLASIACAFSPSIGWMMAARLVQGFNGGWAMVIARSIVVDVAEGAGLVRSLNLVAGVGGIAPIAGPLLGAVILQLTHWRMSFWAVAALAAVMLLAVAVGIPETLPADRRHSGGLTQLARPIRQVLARRRFVGYLIVMAFSMGVTFAYVATSAFILQSMNGLTPLQYSVDFAANAVGLAVGTLVAARLAGRVPTRLVVAGGLVGTGVAGVLLLVGALWFGTPLLGSLVAFFLLMTAQGFVGPNAGRWRPRRCRSTPAPGRRCSGSSSGAWPASSRRSPGWAASTPPSRWR